MIIRKGQTWKARDGSLHKVTKVHQNGTYPVTNDIYSWRSDGKFSITRMEHSLDLMELVQKKTSKPKIDSSKTVKSDMVNHPPHYTNSSIECIDAIEAALTPEEFRGFCKGNALKYSWREKHKGGNEDLKKAQWYLNRITRK